MKPQADPPGNFFKFDRVATKIFPDLWNEKVEIKLRLLHFIIGHSVSATLFIFILILPVAILLVRLLMPVAVIIFFFGIFFGPICGLAAWSDFVKEKID